MPAKIERLYLLDETSWSFMHSSVSGPQFMVHGILSYGRRQQSCKKTVSSRTFKKKFFNFFLPLINLFFLNNSKEKKNAIEKFTA